MQFFFGDIVVVDGENIGVVLKSWEKFGNDGKKYYVHEVYVRMYTSIVEYREDEIERYGVRHKYLSDEEKEYQSRAMQ